MVERPEQPLLQEGEDMPVTVTTDAELDRVLSMRVSFLTPLPPEISLSEEKDARRILRRRTYYSLLGVRDHPLVRFLEDMQIQAAMAASVSRASHLDRVSHYASWRNPRRPVEFIDCRNGSERYLGYEGTEMNHCEGSGTGTGTDPGPSTPSRQPSPPSSPGPPTTPCPHGGPSEA